MLRQGVGIAHAIRESLSQDRPSVACTDAALPAKSPAFLEKRVLATVDGGSTFGTVSMHFIDSLAGDTFHASTAWSSWSSGTIPGIICPEIARMLILRFLSLAEGFLIGGLAACGSGRSSSISDLLHYPDFMHSPQFHYTESDDNESCTPERVTYSLLEADIPDSGR